MKWFTLKWIMMTGVLIACSAIAAAVGYMAKIGKTPSLIRPVQAAVKQEDEKKILKSFYKDEPFEVTDIKIKKSKIKLNSVFSTGHLSAHSKTNPDDWLEDLEFAIKNKSDKQIIYIGIHLAFPESTRRGKLSVWPIEIGQHPLSKRAKENTITLNPNDSIFYNIKTAELEEIKNFLERDQLSLKTLNKVELQVLTIGFSGGLLWEQGDLYQIDSEGKLKKIS